MKALQGRAGALVQAGAAECFGLLRDLERYPQWCGEVVPDARVLERNAGGEPLQVAATLHAALGPLVRDFRVVLAVVLQPPGRIRLQRVPHGNSDHEELSVVWNVVGEANGSRVEVELDAVLSVPRLVPTGGIGETLARQLVDGAARALTT